MISRIKANKLQRHIEETLANRSSNQAIQSLGNINNIGVLVDAKQPTFLEFVRDFSENESLNGKNVTWLAFLPNTNKHENIDFPLVSKKDFNWYYKPITKNIIEFVDQPFDLLLNFSNSYIKAFESICALSAAKYVIGNGLDHQQEYYDMLLKLNNSNAPESFIENVYHYLTLQR